MPMFIREPITSGMGVFSPLKSNLEDMISTCEILDKELAIIAEDGEEFGGLSEETFSHNAPVGPTPQKNQEQVRLTRK